MEKFGILLLLSVASTVSLRTDFLPTARQGCVWSTENANSSALRIPARPNFSLSCNLRTLSLDFWNYTFNKDQIDGTAKVEIKCSDKLLFESYLSPSQSLFQLQNLKELAIRGCKLRKMPTRIWNSLGFLKTLTVQSGNAEWSAQVGLDIETGSFEGLSQLETLDLSQNNVWSLPNKNIFCPLKSLMKLNLSRNRISDLEELSGDLGQSYCSLNPQSLDLSFNSLRKVGNNAFFRFKRLVELRLQNNLLEELEDSGFETLSTLRSLNISSNRLVALPPSIFKFNSALREINLSNNSISALSPKVFEKMENLLLLDLSHNALTSQWVKENMFSGLIRLVILRLSSNQLSFVDERLFKELASLQVLALDGNRIETFSPQAFNSLSNLQVLDLSRNRLSYIDGRVFSNLLSLRQLYLDSNKIRSMDDDSFKNCTSLQDLGLVANAFTEVPVALQALQNLKTLDIGENKIASVSNTSFSGMKQLIGLRIVDNRIEILPPGFCSMKKLRVLNLAQNRISKIAPTAFSSCPELRALRLDTNALDELPPLVPQLPNLLWLNVSENRLKWADYRALPASIEWLDLSRNRLESLGGTASSTSGTSYSLRVLDASFNELKHLDYMAIPPTLETLRVNNNQLKTLSSDTFLRSTRLRTVHLESNQLESLPLSALRFPPVPVDKPLPEFYLGGNNFVCSCEMEWLSRVNQLTVLRTHPRIVDLDSIGCTPSFSKSGQVIPILETKAKDFLCRYEQHCFTLCHCCDFEACDCAMTCPEGCECYHDTAWSSNIVSCSNSNHTHVPNRIPMDASEVYLDGNNFTVLDSHIFIGKKNARILFLNDSRIETIRNKTFNGLKSLEILRLEDNLLSRLDAFEFADLENIREIYLQNNLLRFIASQTFSKLQFLQVLRLDGNLLIDFNVWELSGNGYLNSVMLAGNPWSCDCDFLIPMRTWVASRSSIVVDFTLANCMELNSTHVVSGSSFPGEEGESLLPQTTDIIPKSDQTQRGRKLYPIQMQHPISSMCNHNSEINFSFQHPMETDILNNHISQLAEKVVTVREKEKAIQFDSSDTEAINTFWSLLLSLTALIVLVVVILAIFRKEIYYWVYTRVFPTRVSGAKLAFPCCGDGKRGEEEGDKLFDAYFLYSKKDEEILVQKIAPELESQGPPSFRLCLHYRDLCLNSENPWNTDMIQSACDASKRVVLILSKSFLQAELSHSHFRGAIQSAINRHQKKLILILLPPLSEPSVGTIWPELKSPVKTTMLEWTDKNFWSKLKLILPSPSSNSTMGRSRSNRRGSSLLISSPSVGSPLIDLQGGSLGPNNSSIGPVSSYTINRLEFPYGSQHQYHRNILPYQIPLSGTLNPPVPKHHIALSTPFFQTHQGGQNYSIYNASQYSGGTNPSSHYFIGPRGGSGGASIYPVSTLPHPHHANQPHLISPFNESFRRHLQQQQHQSQVLQFPANANANSTPNRQGGGGGGGPGGNGVGTGYQPLEPNYSSSAMSSSAEELEHVYSTLDSPLQSPHSANTTCTSVEQGSGSESANTSSKSNSRGQQGKVGNNGQMYFV